jgi:hypothetical protein
MGVSQKALRTPRCVSMSALIRGGSSCLSSLDRRCLAFGRQLKDSDGDATWRDGNLAVALGCADPRAADGVQFGVQIADNVLAAVFEIYAATCSTCPPSSVVS